LTAPPFSIRATLPVGDMHGMADAHVRFLQKPQKIDITGQSVTTSS